MADVGHQGNVDRVGQRVNPRRLARPDDHGSPCGADEVIPSDRLHPLLGHTRRRRGSRGSPGLQARIPRVFISRAIATSNAPICDGRQPQPVVGHRAGHGVRRFDDVQPVHRVSRLLDLPPLWQTRGRIRPRSGRMPRKSLSSARMQSILSKLIARDELLARKRSPRPSALPRNRPARRCATTPSAACFFTCSRMSRRLGEGT